MFITEKSHFPSFVPFRRASKDRSLPNNFDLISRSFDENVLRRLKALMSQISDSPSISLSWLSQAVDFLSCTHGEAQALISNLKSSSDDSISPYLDGSVKLLDVCNSISSEIERLRQRRLQINFVLHLLKVSGEDNRLPAAGKLQRSRDSLSGWEIQTPSPKRRTLQVKDPETLIADLAAALGTVPRGKIPSAGQVIRRAIYAVGVLTVFVAGVAVAALYGIPEDVAPVGVPAEFLWADALRDLQSAILEKMKRRSFKAEKKSWLLEELDNVETRVRGLTDVINGVVGVDKEKKTESVEEDGEKLGNAVKELEAAVGRFSDGLDRLADGVNGTFRRVLCTRNGLLEEYRRSHEPYCNERKEKKLVTV